MPKIEQTAADIIEMMHDNTADWSLSYYIDLLECLISGLEAELDAAKSQADSQ